MNAKSPFFFILFTLFLLSGAVLLFIFSKEELFLSVNRMHNDFADQFFRYITQLGNGFFYLLILIIFLFIKYRYAVAGAISFCLTTMVTQGLKHTVFSEALRPVKYFEGIENIYLVPGVEVHSFNSFPSGHTSAAFSVFCLLAMIAPNRWHGVLYFILALLVGCSRMYLSQHFFADVYFGSLIGVVLTYLVVIYINRHSKLRDKTWMDKTVLA